MLKKIPIYVLIFFILVSVSSCSLLDNETVVPAFIIAENPVLTTKVNEGSNTHNIADVWVTVDDDNLGVYTLPNKIPVIPEGENQVVTLRAGIKPNGANSQSLNYPFYEPLTSVQQFTPEEELVIPLEFEYVDDAIFDFVDDFEGSTIFNQDLDGNFDTRIIRTDDDVASGNFSGLVELDPARTEFEVTTTAEFLRANNAGGATFLEFDYKSDVNLAIGYEVNTTLGPQKDYPYIFVPQDEWTHVYLDFTPYLTDRRIDTYKITFFSTYETGDINRLYLDNIKLVHF